MTARRAAGPRSSSSSLSSGRRWRVLDASGQAFWQGLVINLGIFIILTVSLNLTSGFTGVFSLGQIGFMALGAYISAILTLPLAGEGGLPARTCRPGSPASTSTRSIGPVPVGFLAATLIAAVLVSVIAWLVGRVLMRLSGHFVAVATLGFLVIVRVVLFNADAFTRGSRTFSNVTPYTNLWWTAVWALVRSMSSGGSSARATAATCSPSARIAWPPSRSGSGSWIRACWLSWSARSSRRWPARCTPTSSRRSRRRSSTST